MATTKSLYGPVTVLLLMVASSYGLKVLTLFPHFGKSHFDVLQPLIIGLAAKGHEVTVLSHFPSNPPIKGITDISLVGTLPTVTQNLDVDMFKTSLDNFLFLMAAGKMTCEAAYESKPMRELIKSKPKFDVIITEPFNADCMLGLVHYLNAPHIAFSTHVIMPWIHERFGNPDNPAIVANLYGTYSSELTFLERMDNFLKVNLYKFLYYLYSDIPTNKLLQRVFGPEIPPVSELKKDTALLFVNLHYTYVGVRPQVPAIVDIGGIHVKQAKPLDKALDVFINGAEHGVIYVSWGSMIQAASLPHSIRDSLLKAFGSLKQRVLWKWETDNLPGQPKNVMIRKWMPQRDVLAHKNVRVFMSHGGLLGTTEAVQSGVPVIVTPKFGDQFHNSAALRDKGVGLELPYADITTENVIKVIHTALKPSYAENAKKLSKVFLDRPMPPLETAIWWVEHIARTGGDHIRSPVRNMPLYQYLLLDVIGALLLGSALVIYIIYKIVTLTFGKKKTKQD